jgi:hypothetical protein
MSRMLLKRLLNASGVSLIELMVGVSMAAIISLGAAYTLVDTTEQNESIKSMAEQSHVGVDLKTWMNKSSQDLSICQKLNLGKTNINEISAQAATAEGLPISVNISGIPSAFQEGSLYPGQAGIVIQKLRLTNAVIANTGTEHGEHRTYFTGKVILALRKNTTENTVSSSVLGFMTIAVNDVGQVKSCNSTESAGSSIECNNIANKSYSAASAACNLDLKKFLNNRCPAGFTYSGFNYEANTPICLQAQTGCNDSASGLRFALKGMQRKPSYESILNGNPTVSNITSCVQLPMTPQPIPKNPPDKVTILPAQPLQDLGSQGTVECANAANYSDWYNACMELMANAQKTSASGGVQRQITCPPPPNTCFQTTQASIPNQLISTPAKIPSQSSGSCVCGVVPTLSNGQYCGSYYGLGYGFVNVEVKSSTVYKCNDGRLEAIPYATVTPPALKDWMNGQLRQAYNVQGNIYQLQ